MVTESRAVAITGEEMEVEAESLCLHGDTPGAVEMAKTLERQLRASGVDIVPVAQIV